MAEPGPRQVFLSAITRISFSKPGVWCSCSVFLGNLGQGGSCTLTLSGLKGDLDADPPVFPVEPFVIVMGSDGDGNSSFWNIRTNGDIVSAAHFRQTVTLSDDTTMQAYGIREFDGGDNHNGVTFFFKAPGKTFHAFMDATTEVHSPPNAQIYVSLTRFAQELFDEATAITQGPGDFDFVLFPEEDREVTFIP